MGGSKVSLLIDTCIIYVAHDFGISPGVKCIIVVIIGFAYSTAFSFVIDSLTRAYGTPTISMRSAEQLRARSC